MPLAKGASPSSRSCAQAHRPLTLLWVPAPWALLCSMVGSRCLPGRLAELAFYFPSLSWAALGAGSDSDL